MRTISYEEYLNRIYGCFVGKAVSGNIGAPHEGVKMPLDLPFRQDMIDCSRPNDDLDLQILWLDVVEKKGEHFTADDLLERFVTHCAYNPGEYAVMRKNFNRGIYPPYSGSFCNDYYISGMGCPIRSEIWACLAVGNRELAASFASRDGILDHAGESVIAEQFLAALECEAFFEQDMDTLIDRALTVVPPESKFYTLVQDTRAWCREYGDMRTVRTKLLFKYGHPDCTNMFQNLGITLGALLLGGGDIIRTSLLALNCGNDTDCTCATAGAIIGILRGAKELNRAYSLTDTTYVLGVQSDRRSDRIADLAEDIAALGIAFTSSCNGSLTVTDAPAVHFDFEPLPDIGVKVDYPSCRPSIALGGKTDVALTVTNRLDHALTLACTLDVPNGLVAATPSFTLSVAGGAKETVTITFSLPIDVPYIFDCNFITFTARDESGAVKTEYRFGIAGETPYKMTGPFMRTDPICTTEQILAHFSERSPYSAVIDAAYEADKTKGTPTDIRRQFHLNYFPDLDTAYVSEDTLFKPITKERESADYEVTLVNIPEDSFRIHDFYGARCPSTTYLSRVLISPLEFDVAVQIGNSAPYSLYINGECVARRDDCDNYTGENVHLERVHLHKGENRLVLRATNKNDDAKYSIVLSKGACMKEHYVCFASKNPDQW